MAAFSARPTFLAGARCQQHGGVRLRASAVTVGRRLVAVKAVDDASPCDDYHLTADTIAWNAKHISVLKQRIAQVRAKEVVAESQNSRPQLPPVEEITFADVDRVSKWHEEQWERMRAAQQGMWDDELGHFGAPSA